MTVAPWTDEEVKRLNEYQQHEYFHPFTCPYRDNDKHYMNEGTLIATNNGWVCPFCDYTQNWAHDGMLKTLPTPLRSYTSKGKE